MTVTFPREQFTKLAVGLREAKNITSREVVSDQFRLTIRDAIDATPPFDKPGFGKNASSLNVHRKSGERAVKRDLRRVFTPFKSLGAGRGRAHYAVWLRKYAAEGNVRGMMKILSDLGIPVQNIVTNIQSVQQIHGSRRGVRGRVRGGKPDTLVLGTAFADYEKQELKSIGRAKAGWYQLAQIAGITSLPDWISRHAGEAYMIADQRNHPERPQITFGNLVEFVDDFRDLKILETVFENRIVSMQTELDKVMEGNARKRLKELLPA